MTEQTQKTWLEIEAESLGNSNTGERLPAMKFLEENKAETIVIDFSKPFDKYTDTTNTQKNVVKALVPVTHNGEKKIWWLNKKNPAYQEILKAGKAGTTSFKVMRTGTGAATKYIFVK